MAYQFVTINGDGGFSKVNTPPTHSGTVACKSGAAWVRLLHTATITAAADGVNANIADPDTTPFTDGWAYLGEGDALSFGVEQVHETAETEPVAQIDVYCLGAVVVISQH